MLAITFALVLLSCMGLFLPIDFAVAIIAGWAFYIARTLPQVRVEPAGAATAAVCAVLLIAGLQYFLGWLYRETRKPNGDHTGQQPQWKWRWTLSLVTGVILLFAAGTASVGVTHQLGWLINSHEPLVRSDSGAQSAARRAQSTNNLKQMGLALLQYEQTHHVFPPGGVFDQLGRPFQSWQTLILPYMEQEALYQRINFDAPWNAYVNQPVFQTGILAYQRPGVDVFKNESGYALSHYAASVDMLGGDQPRRLADVSDGTSSTLMVGEVVGDFKAWGEPTNWRDPRLGLNKSPRGFGSVSPGGVSFLFVDGSVRFIKNSVDPTVLEALATPSEHEQVGSDQY